MNSRRLAALLFSVASLAAVPLPARAADPQPNTLSDTERADGWRLLFDGRTTTGWRGWRQSAFPDKGWVVEDGCLRHLPKGGGGDVITVEKFGDYELSFEWRINSGGNGGLKYFITEDRAGDAVGHEYQLMGEPTLAAVTGNLLHATGSFYDVLSVSTNFPFRPPESWNQTRIIIHGNSVEHWLNGAKVLAYELGSPEVKAGIARSKFKAVAGFGTKFPHHILLQDHGGDVRYRNLKLHPLPPAAH